MPGRPSSHRCGHYVRSRSWQRLCQVHRCTAPYHQVGAPHPSTPLTHTGTTTPCPSRASCIQSPVVHVDWHVELRVGLQAMLACRHWRKVLCGVFFCPGHQTDPLSLQHHSLLGVVSCLLPAVFHYTRSALHHTCTAPCCAALHRNVTISGPSDRQPDDWPVVNFNFAYAVVELCGTCKVNITHLALQHERRGVGLLYDMFSGLPGSSIVCSNVYRLRDACTPPEVQVKSMKAMQRSRLMPNSSSPQQVSVRDVEYRVSWVDVTHTRCGVWRVCWHALLPGHIVCMAVMGSLVLKNTTT